jgi:hypothetical protein
VFGHLSRYYRPPFSSNDSDDGTPIATCTYIRTHIHTQTRDYYDQHKDRWCPNTKLFVEKVGMHPERIHNLYFAYLFVMRAIAKAAPELMEYDYNTGT